jgi:hypothetical protein
MTKELVRRFCESRHRPLIVIAGTFVVGLLLILPLVDVYYAGREEKSALAAELESAKEVAAQLEGFERRVAEKLTQLAAQEARAVSDETLPDLRSKLLDMAKETNCTIRRLSVGATVSRPWLANDNPVAIAGDIKRNEKGTGFMLESRPLSVSLNGTSAALRSLLERIAESDMLMHTKNLEMYPSSPSRQTLTLDMELWYFALRRGS